jgi:hypothetical protein
MKINIYLVVILALLISPAFNIDGGPDDPDHPGANQATFLPIVNYAGGQPGTGIKAFPGAMGFGSGTPGGRGGKVIYVSNLNDSGPGSLREALTAPGPRVVLFSVSGTITLKNEIRITSPYLTVAGHTAPGEGIQIRDAQIKIATHDIIIRYLKVRSGDAGASGDNAVRDSLTLNGDSQVYNVIVDHSTLVWGPDIGGIAFLNGARDATLSYSIIGEGLYVSNHPEATIDRGGHSMSMNISELSSSSHPSRITIHHNLLTTSSDRNPRVIGGEFIDIVNNVIYNWRNSPSQGNPRKLNLIKNFYIKGPMNTNGKALFAWQPRAESGGRLRSGVVYESGNLSEGFTTLRSNPQSVYAPARFEPYSITAEDSPQVAYLKILTEAGASRQVSGRDGSFTSLRDAVDTRIINNLIDRTGFFINGIGQEGAAGFSAISWPELAGGTPALDADRDGLPDPWEQHYFGNTSRGSADDSSGDYDQDGYTDLEEYLYDTDPTNVTH